jgi:hypothetical protein
MLGSFYEKTKELERWALADLRQRDVAVPLLTLILIPHHLLLKGPDLRRIVCALKDTKCIYHIATMFCNWGMVV